MPQTPGVPDHAAPKPGTIAWADFTEPARVRAVLTAVVALAASLGFVIPVNLPSAAEVIVPIVAFLLPLIQGEATRAVVSSPRTVAEMTAGHPPV